MEGRANVNSVEGSGSVYSWYYQPVGKSPALFLYNSRHLVLASFLLFAHTESFSQTELSAKNSPPSLLEKTKSGFHKIATIGYALGGTEFADAQYPSKSLFNLGIRAGSGFQVGIGGLYQFEQIPLTYSLTANYHSDFDGIGSSNVDFSRFLIEALVFYSGAERMRFGGGIRWVISPNFSADINRPPNNYTYTPSSVCLPSSIDFNNTNGLIAEVGYQIDSKEWINLRYASERYRVSKRDLNTCMLNGVQMGVSSPWDVGSEINGSHLGVNVTFELEKL